MKTTSLDSIMEFLADEGQYASQNGDIRDPRSPRWTFFDDSHNIDPELKAFRDDLLSFEEWNADRGIPEDTTVQAGLFTVHRAKELPPHNNAFIRKVVKVTHQCTQVHSKLKKPVGVPIPEPSHRDKKRALYLTRHVEPSAEGISIEREDYFTPQEAASISRFFERNEARGLCNWLINWHKHRPSTNDHWHVALSRVIHQIPVDDEEAMAQLAKIKKALGAFTNYAPGPLAQTVFKNMDGTRYVTDGVDFGRAKNSYIAAQRKRGHEITDELVSVDRVQYIGEKKSKLVVGVRKASDQTPSNYYDPNPSWMERRVNGEWVKAYAPGDTTIYRVPDSLVLEPGSHRLTVREFEQCIIAGATILDSEDEQTVKELEDEYLPDSRIMLMNFGYGSDGRDPMALSHEEAYLHSVFMTLGARDDDPFFSLACELLCLEDQYPGQLANHFKGERGHPSEQAHMVLNFVAEDDRENQEKHQSERAEQARDLMLKAKTRKEQKSIEVWLERKTFQPMLPYVVETISTIADADIETRADAKSVSRDNKRMLSKEHAPVDYGFQELIGGYRAPW